MPRRRSKLSPLYESLVADPNATYGSLVPLAKGGAADWRPEPQGPGKPPWDVRPEPGQPRFAMPGFARESAIGGLDLLRGAAGEVPAGQPLSPEATTALMDWTGGGWAARAGRKPTSGIELGMSGGRGAASTPRSTKPVNRTMELLRQGGLRRKVSPQMIRETAKRREIPPAEREIVEQALDDTLSMNPEETKKVDLQLFEEMLGERMMPLKTTKSEAYAMHGIRNVDPGAGRPTQAPFLGTELDWDETARQYRATIDLMNPDEREILDAMPREAIQSRDTNLGLATIRATPDQVRLAQQHLDNVYRSRPKAQRPQQPFTRVYQAENEMQIPYRYAHEDFDLGDTVFHTRVYDKDRKTRRLVELQSDIYQEKTGRIPDPSEVSQTPKKYMEGLKLLNDLDKARSNYVRQLVRDRGISTEQAKEFVDNNTVEEMLTDSGNLELADRYDDFFGGQMSLVHGVRESLDNPQRAGLRRKLIEGKQERTASELKPRQKNWWKRGIREEVMRAAAEGKERLQIPTGETAKRIQGWPEGEGNFTNVSNRISGIAERIFRSFDRPGTDQNVPQAISNFLYQDLRAHLEPETLREMHAEYGYQGPVLREAIIEEAGDMPISSVVDDPHQYVPAAQAIGVDNYSDFLNMPVRDFNQRLAETDSAKIYDTYDAANLGDQEYYSALKDFMQIKGKQPVPKHLMKLYNQYERDIPKWIKKEYGAEKVTDEYGFEWWEIPLDESLADEPVYDVGALQQQQRIQRIG